VKQLFVLFCVLLTADVLSAAAPTLTHLYPAGGLRGTTVSMTAAGKLADHPLFVWSSRDDVQVAFTKESGKLDVTIAPDAEPGLCWIRVYNAEGVSAQKPFFVGVIPEVLEQEPNNAVSSAQKLASPMQVVNGVLSSAGEVDMFAIQAKAGQTVVASMTAHETLGSPMDGVLQIVSADGFVLDQNDDDSALDPEIAFVAPTDGTYYVRTFAFAAKPNTSIRLHGAATYIYRLTITTGPFIDHLLPMGATRSAETKLSVHGWNVPDELSELTIAGMADESHRLYWQPQFANTQRLRVASHPLLVENETADSELAPFTPPAALTGHIDSDGDVDTFRLPATKGQKLVIRIDARSLGSPLDPLLALIGPDGKTISEADDSGGGNVDAAVTHTVAADGEHQVRVSSRYSFGGPRFFYVLSIKHPTPDFELSVTSDTFTLAADKPLEIPVAISRIEGFDKEIEITATGLPAGVVTKPVKSAKEGDSSKSVKLIFENSDALKFPGTFQINGKAAGEPAMERTATTTVSGLTAKTESLWLTIPNAALGDIPVEAARPR